MAVKKLLFVDTNKWLDFYRARTEASLTLLEHLDQISDKIIVTWQLEMEFKKNRHAAMIEGMQELKSAPILARPGLFSNTKEVKAIQTSQKRAEARLKTLKAKYVKAFNSPATSDPVYKICQRIFHKSDALVLQRGMPVGKTIRRLAMHRFFTGCPPRKKGDTSMGDAYNWEWMVYCAIEQNAELVIVSRDSDYGTVFEDKCYPNDHLQQEFRERVSRKRKLLLYNKVSDALEHFKVAVTETEKQEEEAIVKAPITASVVTTLGDLQSDPNLALAKDVDYQQLYLQARRIYEQIMTRPAGTPPPPASAPPELPK